MMDFYRLVFVCLIYTAKVFVNSTECKDSATTARKVESCPHNVKEWNEAAARKGCKNISCNSSSLEYHCVINAWGNETIEVCAPSLRIIGSVCTEYNQGGRRIQRNEIVPCEKCPPFYFSNESYKYQECYKHVKNANVSYTLLEKSALMGTESTTQEITYSSSLLTSDENSSQIISIIICVLVGVVAVIIVFTVKQRSCANKIWSLFKRIVFQSDESKRTKSESVNIRLEKGVEVQTNLLENKTIIQDVFYEVNESSDKTNLNAKPS
ncbi:uncharacterized protein LOC128168968 [Crassostrea angulata]|uniref:uncharacterized protein LOC128168968 n=1 Tax=Magallana angulata TaxID=2784310 RepID=UPI0022B13AC7|nr:uncharacterized protein LOC128168968 [Crassostrea angulata]